VKVSYEELQKKYQRQQEEIVHVNDLIRRETTPDGQVPERLVRWRKRLVHEGLTLQAQLRESRDKSKAAAFQILLDLVGELDAHVNDGEELDITDVRDMLRELDAVMPTWRKA